MTTRPSKLQRSLDLRPEEDMDQDLPTFVGPCALEDDDFPFEMISDVADYSEWKNNRRATAIIFSAMLIGLKAGLTIGGSLVAGLLAYYGYSATLATQNPETVAGIKAIMSVYASLPFYLSVACLFFYSINKKMELTIEADLNARRQAAGK